MVINMSILEARNVSIGYMTGDFKDIGVKEYVLRRIRRFPGKSEAKMREIIESGVATILVSHSIDQVRTMCNKILWLHKGQQIVFSDDVQGVCDSYAAFLAGDQSQLGRYKKTDELKTARSENVDTDQEYNFDAHDQLQQTLREDVENNFMIRAFYLLFAALSVSSLVYLKNDIQNKQVMLYTMVFFVGYLGAIGVYCFIMRKIEPILKRRDWMILLCAVVAGGILVRLGTLYFLQTQPVSDFETPFRFCQYYQTHGPYTESVPWSQRDFFQLYYTRFPAWFPYMRLIMLIYDLFGENLRWIQMLDMLLAGASIIAIYFTISSKTTALLASALFAFNPSLIVYSCITTPDHITILLFILAVFFWRRLEENRINWLHNKKGRIYALAIILCCMLINLFKPLSILFAVVFICYESVVHLYPALRARLPIKQLWKTVLSGELAFLLILLCGIAATNAALQYSVERMFQTEVVNSTSYYILLGCTVDEDGKYDAYNNNVGNKIFSATCEKYENDYTKVFPEIERLAKEQIRKNLPLLPSIWQAKHEIAFSSEYSYFSFSNTSADEAYKSSVQKTCQIPLPTAMLTMMRLLYAFSALFALVEISGKKISKQMLLAAIIIVGYVLVLILGGVQSRYKSLIVPLWCMISAHALCTVCIHRK